MKLLLIEDSEMYRKMVRAWTENSVYQIDYAETGEEAIYLFDRNEYDLIILDFFLPFISGMEVYNYIGKSDRNPVIILMTAHIEYCKDYHVKHIYSKPYTHQQFFEILSEVEKIERKQ